MIMAAKRSVIMQIENVVNKNIDARNGNAQTESVGISDYIRDDVKSDCEKKAATDDRCRLPKSYRPSWAHSV